MNTKKNIKSLKGKKKSNTKKTTNKNKINNKIYDNIYNKKQTNDKNEKNIDTINFILELKNKFENNVFDDNLLNTIDFFDKKKMGKSGGKIGLINYKNDTKLIKIYKKSKNTFFIKKIKNCIYLNFDFNELLISYLLNNLKLVLNKKDFETFKNKKYKKHIVKNYLCKINRKNIFVINELLGINYNGKFYTNLYEVLVYNYIPYVNLLLKNNNQNELNKFLKNFCKLLNPWFNVQMFLNEKLSLINTDIKLENIFIRKLNSNKNTKYIKNITLLISDLDKSRYKLNNNKILCKLDGTSQYLRQKIIVYTRFKHIYKFRYDCLIDENYCYNFKEYHFDRLILIFSIYTLMYLNIYKPYKKTFININDYFNKFKILNNCIKNALSINDKQFELFKLTINESVLVNHINYNKNKNFVPIVVNALVYNFCRKLGKGR